MKNRLWLTSGWDPESVRVFPKKPWFTLGSFVAVQGDVADTPISACRKRFPLRASELPRDGTNHVVEVRLSARVIKRSQ